MNGESSEYNFWPSFADLMASFVLILVVIIAIVATAFSVGLKYVKENQKKTVEFVAQAYDVEAVLLAENLYGISVYQDDVYDIIISNEPQLQKITFSDHILFVPNGYKLDVGGEKALLTVGNAIKGQLSKIREIQIQGHADTDSTTRFSSNLHLGAYRAIEVFQFLQKRVGIDPVQNQMSVASFGEYMPVQRSETDAGFNAQKLSQANLTQEMKARNRRIELRLFYRY